MDYATLSHADILPASAVAHITRTALLPTRPKRLHTHDFTELFWVQNGKARHHLPDGRDTLVEGDLVVIPPGAAHALQGRGDFALVVSVCLHPRLVADLVARHADSAGSILSGSTPFQTHRNMRQLAALNQAALQLERSPLDALSAEAFLLPLLADLHTDRRAAPDDAPAWLQDACRAARDPNLFRGGAGAFAAHTGKAHAHVSRSMQRYLGTTPSEFINGIRMDHAARALITDVEPLAQIAADVGVPNLSHFHKLFRRAHGITPLKYRQQFQRHVVQPD